MKICAAAIKMVGEEKTVLISGANHADCENYARDMGIAADIKIKEAMVRGFVTSDLTFVDRFEALVVAKDQQQLIEDYKTADRMMSYMLDMNTIPDDKKYLLGTGIVGPTES